MIVLNILQLFAGKMDLFAQVVVQKSFGKPNSVSGFVDRQNAEQTY